MRLQEFEIEIFAKFNNYLTLFRLITNKLV